MIKSGMKNHMIEKNNTYLEVILDNNDEFVECIEQAFRDHNIKKASLVSAEGMLKETTISTTRSGTIRQRIYLQPCKIRYVSGEFYESKNDYYGDIHISIAKDQIHQVTGLLLRGIADGEVSIKFKVIKNDGQELENKDSEKQITMLKQKILDETQPKPKKPIIEA
jgi:predicted DNA-binding protein with PD1-like motif